MAKLLSGFVGRPEQISVDGTAGLRLLSDTEVDAVAGGLLNNNNNNTGIGAVQGGTGNVNVALANIGIGVLSLL